MFKSLTADIPKNPAKIKADWFDRNHFLFKYNTMIIDLKKVKKLRTKYPDKKIVFCSGTFDLTHAGHILFFEDCKKHGNILVVMIGDDETIKKNKGNNRPILNQDIRLKTVDSIKPVDYCLINPYPEVDRNFNRNFETIFRFLKPDVWVVNNDASDIDGRKKLADNHKLKLVVLPRSCPKEFELISTSAIINKIKGSKNI